ncbi:MAG: hypothetical protein JXR37_02795 [Kiritimatiellae bacterium]|nr:hypothetical protein [Kiritimatiellia bacterium]
MISRELARLVAPLALVQRVLWGAMLATLAVYVAVAFVVGGRDGAPAQNMPQAGRWALWCLGPALVAGAFAVRRLLFSDARIRTILAQPVDAAVLASNPQTGQVDTKRLEELKALEETDQRLYGLARRSLMGHLLSWALAESCGLMGLVLAIVERAPRTMLPFAAVSMLGMLGLAPQLQRLLDRARQLAVRDSFRE